MSSRKIKAAIIGSGNIGTDLMIKIMRHGRALEMGAMVGIDAGSDGLARAPRLGVATTHEGVEGLVRLPVFADIEHRLRCDLGRRPRARTTRFLRELKPEIRMVDLTPAAIGPYCVPVGQRRRAPGGAQRQHGDLRRTGHDPDGRRGRRASRRCTTRRSSPAFAAESAGPGTRANIDEFTETTVAGDREGRRRRAAARPSSC